MKTLLGAMGLDRWQARQAPVAPPTPDAPRETVALDAFLARLEADGEAMIGAELNLDFGADQQALPVKVFDVAGHGRPLIVTFHGAVDQGRRSLPCFAGRFIPREAGRVGTVLALCDPALGLAPHLKLTWFAASHRSDTPGHIRSLVARAAERLGAPRVVFVGGSAGAYAALAHSRLVPESVAVVINPRLHIRPSSYWRDYRRTCWPADAAPKDIVDKVPHIADLYTRTPGTNTVVYLLNALDLLSVKLGAALLHRLDGLQDVLLQVEHWPGFTGHIYPLDHWAAWIRAAAAAPCSAVADIAAHKLLLDQQMRSRSIPAAALPAPDGFSEADLRLARALAAIAE